MQTTINGITYSINATNGAVTFTYPQAPTVYGLRTIRPGGAMEITPQDTEAAERFRRNAAIYEAGKAFEHASYDDHPYSWIIASLDPLILAGWTDSQIGEHVMGLASDVYANDGNLPLYQAAGVTFAQFIGFSDIADAIAYVVYERAEMKGEK